MLEREITHLALTIHFGESIGEGNACTTFDFEVGKCDSEDKDDDEDKIIGKSTAMAPRPAARQLIKALECFLRKEFGVGIVEVIEGRDDDD